MVKLVDTRDLKSLGASCTGSSPVRATNSPPLPFTKVASQTYLLRLLKRLVHPEILQKLGYLAEAGL